MEAQERTIALRVQQALVEHERQHSAVLHEEVKKSQQLELGLLQATNKLQELCDSLPPATRDPRPATRTRNRVLESIRNHTELFCAARTL